VWFPLFGLGPFACLGGPRPVHDDNKPLSLASSFGSRQSHLSLASSFGSRQSPLSLASSFGSLYGFSLSFRSVYFNFWFPFAGSPLRTGQSSRFLPRSVCPAVPFSVRSVYFIHWFYLAGSLLRTGRSSHASSLVWFAQRFLSLDPVRLLRWFVLSYRFAPPNSEVLSLPPSFGSLRGFSLWIRSVYFVRSIYLARFAPSNGASSRFLHRSVRSAVSISARCVYLLRTVSVIIITSDEVLMIRGGLETKTHFLRSLSRTNLTGRSGEGKQNLLISLRIVLETGSG